MRASLGKRWWLLPAGILVVSALLALNVVVFGPPFGGRSSGEAAQRPAGEAVAADCSGALATDYACHQERYRALVLDSGAEAAFADLKDEHEKSGFVRAACHQLTHVIGRTAAERYGDVAGAYARGDPFCSSGYYHGVTEALVGEAGAEKMLEGAEELCAGLRERQKYSLYHFGCAHGLGHGFMAVLENELFESLRACDALKDGWEREACAGGVFMENIVAMDDPIHPSKYLKAGQPLYPCTGVEARHKNECYKHQTGYALFTRSDDYAEVFDLCATVEDDPHPGCYQGLGKNAALHGIKYVNGDVARAESTQRLCMVGEDPVARSNCVIGAVRAIINYYANDARVKALCETFEADLRAVCFRTAEEYHEEAALPDQSDEEHRLMTTPMSPYPQRGKEE